MCYECVVCKALNHISRLHCQVCGAVPAKLSAVPGKTMNYENGQNLVAAIGVMRAERTSRRLGLQTVSLDYYGDAL